MNFDPLTTLWTTEYKSLDRFSVPLLPKPLAYGGSCTAGKYEDMDMYARVVKDALARGLTIKKGVTFYIQYGSKSVSEYAKACGHPEVFLQAGVKVIPPGCGPGMSTDKEQITVSAINRISKAAQAPRSST